MIQSRYLAHRTGRGSLIVMSRFLPRFLSFALFFHSIYLLFITVSLSLSCIFFLIPVFGVYCPYTATLYSLIGSFTRYRKLCILYLIRDNCVLTWLLNNFISYLIFSIVSKSHNKSRVQ